MTQEEDAADVHKVLAGDVSAFEGIVARWQAPLVNLTWRASGRRDTAEDLAQECFLKVFRALASWGERSSFSTWMFAVAMNHCRSRLRNLPRELAGLESAFDLPDPRALSDGADEVRVEALRRAIAGLPPHYRDAIVLHYLREHDVRRSAEILGIAEGTLKARLARARALLFKSLDPRARRKSMSEEV